MVRLYGPEFTELVADRWQRIQERIRLKSFVDKKKKRELQMIEISVCLAHAYI